MSVESPQRNSGCGDGSEPSVVVLNGPNLNLLGTREPEVYGSRTLADVEGICRDTASQLGLSLDFRQSNHEGQLVDWVQEVGQSYRAGRTIGAVFNPGAYTHTSLALQDAIKGVDLRVVELHLSNVHAREATRNHSYVSPVAAGIVIGFGVAGYSMAIRGLHAHTATGNGAS
jgi:3-dehydroquinate dehydratase-2